MNSFQKSKIDSLLNYYIRVNHVEGELLSTGWQLPSERDKDHDPRVRFVRTYGGTGTPFVLYEFSILQDGERFIPVHGSVKMTPCDTASEAANMLMDYWHDLPLSHRTVAGKFAEQLAPHGITVDNTDEAIRLNKEAFKRSVKLYREAVYLSEHAAVTEKLEAVLVILEGLQADSLVSLDGLQQSDFDAVEVHPCAYVDGPEQGLEQCSEDDPALAMWSVYFHLRDGGLRCVADADTKDAAYKYAALLQGWLGSHLVHKTDWSLV